MWTSPDLKFKCCHCSHPAGRVLYSETFDIGNHTLQTLKIEPWTLQWSCQTLWQTSQLFTKLDSVGISESEMTLPGGSNPADVLFKLAKGRGLASPTFEQVNILAFVCFFAPWFSFYWIKKTQNLHPLLSQVHEGGPPHAKTFTWVCNWLQVPGAFRKWWLFSLAFIVDPQGKYFAEGCGRSKKEAKNASAKVFWRDVLYVEDPLSTD